MGAQVLADSIYTLVVRELPQATHRLFGRRGSLVAPLIAVVDDDDVIVTLLDEILTDEGYRTRSFPTVAEARDGLPALQPDLIMLDLRLGGTTSGWDLLTTLRQMPATAAIPILICSADARFLQEHADTLQTLGCATMQKPFDLDVLLRTIAALIASRDQGEQSA